MTRRAEEVGHYLIRSPFPLNLHLESGNLAHCIPAGFINLDIDI